MTSVTRQINFKEAQERYELEATPASFSVDGNGVCNDTVVVRLYHVKGGEKEEIQGDGVTLSVDGSSVGNFTLPLSLHASAGNNDAHSAYVSSFLSAGSKSFLVSAAHGSNALTIPVIRNGEKGATPRIQAWSDLPVGYHFYQGTTGEEYKDTVICNGNYYTCVKSHVKTSDNYPASTTDTNNGYWKSGEKIELVATNLLLSAYAIIKNLGVEAIEMKDPKDNSKILFQAKDGNVVCKTGTFENVQISGVLNGVSGTFSKLTSLDDNGNPAVAIYFNNSEGHLTFEGDIYNQGYDSNKGRSYRFYTSDVWCRGSFGAAGRNVLVVTGTGGFYYTKGTDKYGTYIPFPEKTSSNGTTYYVLNCYGESGDAAGFPVDTIIFNSSIARNYSILAFSTQRIMVVNGNDKKEQYVYSNGSLIKWNGGDMAEVIQLPTNTSFMNPVNTDNIGCGLLVGAFRDNNWS